MNRVPPDQSPASRSAVKSACISSNGVCEAGRSEGAGRVIEPRNSVVVVIGITALGSQRGKADGLLIPEGSSLGGRYGYVLGAPPGSEGGACTHRGNSGTWEDLLSPSRGAGRDGPPAEQRSRRRKGFAPCPPASRQRHTNQTVQARVSGNERGAKDFEMGSRQS